MLQIRDIDREIDPALLATRNMAICFHISDIGLNTVEHIDQRRQLPLPVLGHQRQWNLIAVIGGIPEPGDIDDPLAVDKQVGDIAAPARVHTDPFSARDVPDDRFSPDRLAAGCKVGHDVVDPILFALCTSQSPN